jgi:hypothetical protein
VGLVSFRERCRGGTLQDVTAAHSHRMRKPNDTVYVCFILSQSCIRATFLLGRTRIRVRMVWQRMRKALRLSNVAKL